MNEQRTLLVAIDFSGASGSALKQAARLAAADRLPLHALHIVDVPARSPVPAAMLPIPLPSLADLLDDARRRWAGFAPDTTGKDLVHFEAVAGNPRREIVERVRTQHPALLVMGADGGMPTGVGTLAAACVRDAAAPVLLVQEGQTGPYRTITACTDFSPASGAAVALAARFADRDSAELLILTVFDDPWGGPLPAVPAVHSLAELKSSMRRAVADQVRSFADPFVAGARVRPSYHAVEHDRREGNHGRGIVRFLIERRADLCILAAHSAASVREYILGTTADRVLRDAPCGILAVKPAAGP